MAKAKKVEFGIEITKPWSKEMYNHNDKIADEVREWVTFKWQTAYEDAEHEFINNLEEDQIGLEFNESDWSNANDEMIEIQKAVTCYGLAHMEIYDVTEEVESTLEDAAYWRLSQIVEELEIELEEGFIGL